MQMLLTDMLSSQGSPQRVNGSTGSAGMPARVDSSARQAGGFRQLLARITAQGEMQDAGTMAQAGQLLGANELMPLMNPGSSELEGAEALAWLLQTLDLLQRAEAEFESFIEQHPELAQFLAATLANTVLPDEAETFASDEGAVKTSLQHKSALPGQLKDRIQQFITKLSSNGTSDHQQVLGQAKEFKQALQPLLAAYQDQAELELAPSPANQSALLRGHEGILRSHDGSALQLQPFEVPASGEKSQHIAMTNGARMAETPQQGQMVVHVTKKGMLPRTDLLRPELLNLALSDAVETAVSDAKPVDGAALVTLSGEPLQLTLEQAVPRQHAHPMPTHVPVHRFAEELSQFAVRSFQINQLLSGRTEARITLVPEHLGHVEIQLTMQNGQLTAQLITETAHGREMLEQQIAALRTALQTQGIQVERLEVTQQQTLSASTFLKDQSQQQSRSYEQQQRSNAKTHDEELIEVGYDLSWIDTDPEEHTGRSSFHATA
ncbi:hypothetical protein PRECH8_10230 [Insulibacter thermoxylanivorax]|uniref:Flagellar hook-length control protein-like C-terminal domain-containing protein n=1 Tax=Insulibacter thermoxylanivorax TaxID=2749268 RepID=A0A916QBK8_9BACL|nr:flagellar hook-length control protein FliK [Insulibacter thermoxylanivorax]GFR37727.1 hypothetical protein PRECH8_10230 [Insulibacter thermoxylanivorax]